MAETPERIWVTFARGDKGRDPNCKGSGSYIGDASDGPTEDDDEPYVPAYLLDEAVEALEWISLGPGYHESKEDAVLEMMRVASAALTPSERKDR